MFRHKRTGVLWSFPFCNVQAFVIKLVLASTISKACAAAFGAGAEAFVTASVALPIVVGGVGLVRLPIGVPVVLLLGGPPLAIPVVLLLVGPPLGIPLIRLRIGVPVVLLGGPCLLRVPFAIPVLVVGPPLGIRLFRIRIGVPVVLVVGGPFVILVVLLVGFPGIPS